MIIVLSVRVDFGLGPSEDPELVLGPEVDNGECNGAGSGFPSGRGGEESVANEIFVVGVGG